jgi:hypothetical protein
LCIIDDNFLRGTLVYWDWFDDFGNLLSTETIEIPYEIIGKGSLIYHWVKNQDSGWDIVGDHYKVGDKFKLVIKKR